jgi:hypothetical protein
MARIHLAVLALALTAGCAPAVATPSQDTRAPASDPAAPPHDRGVVAADRAVRPADRGVPEVYNSGDDGEIITSLPVTRFPGAYSKRVVYCVDLGDPPLGGEVLFVHGDVEVTNDLGYNVSFETHLLLTESCTAVTGHEISEANGFNVTPAMHHGTASRSGGLVVESGNTHRHVALVAWSGSTAAPRRGAALKVERDYGRLTVLRWR